MILPYHYNYLLCCIHAFNINHSGILPLMALNSLCCADVPSSNYSLTHCWTMWLCSLCRWVVCSSRMNLKWPRTAFHYWKAPMKGCFVGLQSTSYTVCFNRNCFTAAPANVSSIIIICVIIVIVISTEFLQQFYRWMKYFLYKWKSTQRRRKHCALAVVRRTHKQTNT